MLFRGSRLAALESKAGFTGAPLQLQDENIIFFSNRAIELSTDPRTGDISSYQVEGVQKMIFGDTLRYEVKANL